jgi:hypothetical protein
MEKQGMAIAIPCHVGPPPLSGIMHFNNQLKNSTPTFLAG